MKCPQLLISNFRQNKIVDISQNILRDEPEPINIKTEVNISSRGKMSNDSYNDKIKALYNWIKPYIKVESAAKVNFPRYGKGFVIGDSYELTLKESKEEYDSCTVSFIIKHKGSNSKPEYIVKNQKDVEAKLISIYGNTDMLSSIWSSFPQRDVKYSTSPGKTYMMNVHLYKRKITYSFNNKMATYMLPFVYIWGEPVKK